MYFCEKSQKANDYSFLENIQQENVLYWGKVLFPQKNVPGFGHVSKTSIITGFPAAAKSVLLREHPPGW